MPLIEVDDTTAAAMQQYGIKYTDRTAADATHKRIVDGVRALETGPHRQKYLSLLKEQFPDLVIPEIDAAKPVNDAVAALDKRFTDFLDAQEKREKERSDKEVAAAAGKTVDQGRRWLRSTQKLDDEGVTAVEKIMEGEGIPNYQAAYLLWKDRNPSHEVDLPALRSSSYDWFKSETDDGAKDLKMRLSDPRGYRQRQIPKLLGQFRRGEIDEYGRPTGKVAAA
jgi:hypothetical protein